MYSIDPADRLKVKLFAGRIIPAIVTSTALICGYSGLEMYKVALLILFLFLAPVVFPLLCCLPSCAFSWLSLSLSFFSLCLTPVFSLCGWRVSSSSIARSQVWADLGFDSLREATVNLGTLMFTIQEPLPAPKVGALFLLPLSFSLFPLASLFEPLSLLVSLSLSIPPPPS